MQIKEINALQTYPVRHPVLRAGQPITACAFTGDDLATTIHLGAYIDQQLVGVASFLLAQDATIHSRLHLIDQVQYQLRGMAVLDYCQGQQIGQKIVQYAHELLSNKRVAVLWCNARESAAGFYKKMGYTIVGTVFDVPTIGPHYKMYKEL